MEIKNNKENQEAVNIFLEECEEILENFDDLLLKYEKNRDNQIIIDLKRNAHSIKGSAGILGLKTIQELSHKTEDFLAVLSEESDKKLKETIDKILDLTDEINILIKETKKNSLKTPEVIINELIKNIPLLKTDIKISEQLIIQINQLLEKNLSSEISDLLEINLKIAEKISEASKIKDTTIINVLSGAFKTLKKFIYDDTDTSELIFIKQKLNLTYQMIDGYVGYGENSINSTTKQNSAHQKLKKKIDIDVLDNLQQGAFRTLRVETSKIDKLYYNVQNLEKELAELNNNLSDVTVSFNQLAEQVFNFEIVINSLMKFSENKELSAYIKKLKNNAENMQNILKDFCKYGLSGRKKENNIIEEISEIKNAIRDIRILPIGVILHMFPRMARDIAVSLGKEVDFEITGGQICIDKSIIEEIKMPLLHILRNAVGHGIELPEIREKTGKPRMGKIIISVNQSDNRVLISVKDDGCGININKIKEKAIKNNIIENSNLSKFSKYDFLKIIFRPGFSTEDKVTEISGRGMGLDIVNNKVKALNGKIKIITETGVGTEIILDLPVDKFLEADKAESLLKNNSSKPQIILVDDSRAARIFFSKILENAGYNCASFDSAKKSLDYLKKNVCGLIITDIEMPEMNGYEFVSKIKKEKSLKNIPVIAISMLTEEKARQKFKNNKIDCFINKSDFSEEKLLKIVSELLGIK